MSLIEASSRLAWFLSDLAKPDAISIKDAFGGKLDLGYVRTQCDAAGADVRRRLDLLFPA